MKKIITVLFMMTCIYLSAQPTLTITSVQAHPIPTYTSSNTLILSKVAISHALSAVIATTTLMGFSINVSICYYTSTTTALTNQTDTIELEQIPAGLYTVTIQYFVSSNGSECEPVGSTTYKFDVIAATGIDELTFKGLLVYPNPFTDRLQFESKSENDFEYRIVSLNGSATEWKEVGSSNMQFMDLASGLYILEIKNADQVMRKKIVKTD
jgi:hypothetical protein